MAEILSAVVRSSPSLALLGPPSDPPPPALVWTMILGFGFFALAGLYAVLRSRGRSRRAVKVWRDWAEARGHSLEVRRGGLMAPVHPVVDVPSPADPTRRLRLEALWLELPENQKNDKSLVTRASLRDGGPDLDVLPRRGMFRIAQLLGAYKDRRIGDPAYDEAFLLHELADADLAGLLDEQGRALHLAWPAWRLRRARGRLEILRHEVCMDPAELEAMVALLGRTVPRR